MPAGRFQMDRQPEKGTNKAKGGVDKIPDEYGGLKLLLGLIAFFALIHIGVALGIIPATESGGDPDLYQEIPDTSGH